MATQPNTAHRTKQFTDLLNGFLALCKEEREAEAFAMAKLGDLVEV